MFWRRNFADATVAQGLGRLPTQLIRFDGAIEQQVFQRMIADEAAFRVHDRRVALGIGAGKHDAFRLIAFGDELSAKAAGKPYAALTAARILDAVTDWTVDDLARTLEGH